MKKLNSFISRFLAVCLSGTITYLSVPDVEGLVISDDDSSDEPSIISIVEGEPSIYGETSIIYLDEDNNVITPNLIPDSTDKATLYPTSYDLRDYGYVTSVKNQENTSTCWAHATLASAESNMIMKGLADQSIDLSESHLVWFSLGKTSTDWNDPLFNDGYDYGSYAYDRGGNHRNSQYTLARGSGIQLEENSAPVTDYSIIDEEQRYTSYGLLTNSDVMAATDFDSIKDHIMNTGALYISYYSYNNYYSSTYNSYYQNTYTTSNHAVTIVGWDDNFSRYNFGSSIPESDGAWICKNSWGDDWGDDGYFYLSYYDTSIQDCITSFEISDVSTYDNIYQYDGSLTQGRYYNDDAISTANIFTADSNETLSAVSFYTYEASVPYIISVYTNVEEGKPTSGKRVAVQRGTMDYEGYHVVDLNNYISLDEGTNFSIVVTLDKEGTLMWFDSCENLSDCSYYTKGVATSNSSWGDAISKFGYTACIKALTKSDILIDSDHFPDESFREFISLNFDTDHDGMLSVEEIADVTYMDAKNLGIYSFEGIKYFTYLTSFNCSDNPIVSLDLSENTNLSELICENCSRNIGEIPCSSLSIDDIDLDKVSDISGAYIENNTLIPEEETITYTYDCGNDFDAVFTLSATAITHTFDDWIYNTSINHKKTCSVCGIVVTNEHLFGDWEDNGDTHVKTCSVCEVSIEESHSFGTWSNNGLNHIRYCSVCDAADVADHLYTWIYSNDKTHLGSCIDCGYVVSEEHDFSDWVDDENGGHVKTCSVCGYSEAEEHSLDDWYDDGNGNHIRICSVCGYSESEEHDLSNWTYDENGNHVRICSVCGYDESEEHDFSDWTDDDNGCHIKVCSVCGYSVLGFHELDEWTDNGNGNHVKTCSVCDYTESEEHDFSNWSYDKNGNHVRSCSVCGYTESEKHDFSDWEYDKNGNHVRSCSVCDYTESEKHNFNDWSYDNNGNHVRSCSVCGYTESEEHDFSDWSYDDNGCHIKVCSVCGYTESEKHNFNDWSYDNNGNHVRSCSVCGYTESEGHDFSDWADDENNNHVRSCSVCGYTESEGHDFSDWADDENNNHVRNCSVCGYTESEKHDFDEWILDKSGLKYRACNVCGFTESEIISFTSGDINNDGVIDVFDLVIAKSSLINNNLSDDTSKLAADVNHDGVFNIADIVYLQSFLLGRISEL